VLALLVAPDEPPSGLPLTLMRPHAEEMERRRDRESVFGCFMPRLSAGHASGC
jgi:hypothetical protein